MAKIDLSNLNPTYQIEEPPEPSMDWYEYLDIMMSKWSKLLESNPEEKDIQKFLKNTQP